MTQANTHLTRAQRRSLQQATADAAAVLEHAPSRRFICRMLEQCGYDVSPFAGNSNTTFVQLGKQEAARIMVDNLKMADPDALIKLLKTAAEQRDRDRDRREDKSDED